MVKHTYSPRSPSPLNPESSSPSASPRRSHSRQRRFGDRSDSPNPSESHFAIRLAGIRISDHIPSKATRDTYHILRAMAKYVDDAGLINLSRTTQPISKLTAYRNAFESFIHDFAIAAHCPLNREPYMTDKIGHLPDLLLNSSWDQDKNADLHDVDGSELQAMTDIDIYFRYDLLSRYGGETSTDTVLKDVVETLSEGFVGRLSRLILIRVAVDNKVAGPTDDATVAQS